MRFYGRNFLINLILFLCSGLTAHAASIDEARANYQSARFDIAYAQAFALGTPEGYILSAKILNAKLLLGEYTKPKKLAKRSMAAAKMAFVESQDNEDARLQYTIAYAFYGRHVSNLSAYRKKIPQKIHAEIEASLALSQNAASEVRALNHALLGGWHLSVVQKAGVKRAQKLFGANEAEGRKHFEKAIALEPNNILISSNYTLMRYMLAPTTEHEWAKHSLTTLLTFTPQNQVEAKLQSRMQIILDAFGTPKKARKLTYEFLN